MSKTRVLIMGAAGRDFHNFNVYFRDNADCDVVAFTATQIPNIEGRLYPAELAGRLYPKGIPIYPESDLVKVIPEMQVDQVVFAYSDVPHVFAMHQASIVLAAGADFRLMGGKTTMIKSSSRSFPFALSVPALAKARPRAASSASCAILATRC